MIVKCWITSRYTQRTECTHTHARVRVRAYTVLSLGGRGDSSISEQTTNYCSEIKYKTVHRSKTLKPVQPTHNTD